ncbi:group 1 glycosyl transferase [Flammeovirgaceae bacterium 311]|nr:group 1 glycosyl transferase [Flammeovirgaceae bacterium 311]
MNIFIVPSWYPSIKIPIAGIFFKEQASYLAEIIKDINVGVSLWGQSDPDLGITKNIPSSLRALYNFSRIDKNTKITAKRPNLYEYYTPVLNWSHKLLDGNMSGIVKANLSNLQKFEQQYGKVDVIHAHVSYPAGYIAMALSKQLGIPYVITEHMGPFPFDTFLNEGVIHPKLAEAISEADQVLAVSPSLSKNISKFGFKEPAFIPNVIDEDFFNVGEPVSAFPFRFFTLANLSPEKGIDDLLAAVAIVTKQKEDVCFNIGGGGSYLDSYRAKSKKMGISRYINWLGQLSREEAREQYQKCNAFILPSHGETFGVVYAEAISSGKPVIATRCGGPECIVDEKNGLLANVKDPADLAEKIIYMIENYQRFDALEIRRQFESKFSKNVVIPKIVEVYRSIV